MEADGGDASGTGTSRSKPSQGLKLATSVVGILAPPRRDRFFGATQGNRDTDAYGHRRSLAPGSFC